MGSPNTRVPSELPLKPGSERQAPGAGGRDRMPSAMGVAMLVLVIGFGKPLLDLVVFASHSDIYSHILLIPFLTVYLLRSSGEKWAFNVRPDFRIAAPPAAIGLALLGAYWITRRSGPSLAREDYLALVILAFVFLVFGVAAASVPRPKLRTAAFPLAFLLFLAPFPSAVLAGIEKFLQHGSAFTADWLLSLSGMPLVREGTFFRLPGFSMQVAPECSGIRSTLVLFITSLAAGYLFLRSPGKRAILTAAVLPLALLRNGLRIFTIGQLCVHVSPSMIDSPIHRKGGPIFFALSLIPFFLLLLWLRRMDRKSTPEGDPILNASSTPLSFK